MRDEKRKKSLQKSRATLTRPIGGIETNILNGTEWRDGGKNVAMQD